MTQFFSGMIIDYEIMGSRGLLSGRGASPLPLRGVMKGARCDLERQEVELPLSFFSLLLN